MEEFFEVNGKELSVEVGINGLDSKVYKGDYDGTPVYVTTCGFGTPATTIDLHVYPRTPAGYKLARNADISTASGTLASKRLR